MRSASDRILAAAMQRFADHGYAGASVRAIAANADVSPALVLHHFGSKDGLLAACDAVALASLQDQDQGVWGSQPGLLDPADSAGPVIEYAVRRSVEGAASADALLAGIIATTADALDALGRAVRPSADPAMRAALLVAMQMGAFMLAGAIEAATGSNIRDAAGRERFGEAFADLMADGLFVPHRQED